MKSFVCPTRILSGEGALSYIKTLQAKCLLVVTDPFFAKNGTAEQVCKLSGAEKLELFDEVAPDPTVTLAARGAAVVRALQPDTVVALGGGSAMDCAKAMVYFSGVAARLVAVPTTSGSGSEVTDFAVLTHEGVKHPLVDEKLRPHIAILDSDLLTSLPKGLIADTGFDVLAHALESYVASNASHITDALAQSAFCTAFAQLPASYSGDKSVRLRLHMASCMAGLSFTQAGLGLCHAISHSLGGVFHVPHGRLGAILLPAVVGCNSVAAGEKYAALAARAGIGGSAKTLAVKSLQNGLARLRRELGLPATLSQVGITPQMLYREMPAIVEATLHDPCCATNPVAVKDYLVRQVLEEVAGRG